MEYRILSLILALLLFSDARGLQHEERAKDYLRQLEQNSNYNKNVLPVGTNGPGTPVKVTVTSHILDIHKVDDYNLDFNAHFYFRQSWKDPRLSYNLNVDSLVFNSVDHIWTPDLFFVEEREGSLHQITKPNIFCRIKPDGEVLYSTKYSVKLSCPMDLRNYPHDTQKCTINAESYGFTRDKMELEWYNGTYTPLSFPKDLEMLEFELTEAVPSTKHIEISNRVYSRLQISLTLKRKLGFFTIRLYVPLIILVLMASLSFWIRSEERSLRLALLIVILYLVVTISTSMNNVTPPAPYTKASDVWIGFCGFFVFSAFLEFILVALIFKTESEDDFKIRGEILSLDPENKEDKMKTTLSKLMNLFHARQGGIKNSLSLRIDMIFRVVFPIFFVIFNIIYWSVYCCSS